MASLLLKDFPLDVRKIVIRIQGEVKNEKGISQYSMEQAIYKIVREYPSLINEKNKK